MRLLTRPCAGDVLDIMELRHDWAKFNMTPELFKDVLTRFIPDVIFHSQRQDEEQVREHYDRACFITMQHAYLPLGIPFLCRG